MHVLERRIGRPILLSLTNMIPVSQDEKELQMKRKHEIICSSEIEMDRRADNLIEQGYKVERNTGVVPAQSICIPIYKVIFWR